MQSNEININKIIKNFDLKPKFFLKIDIEGSEYEILQDIISSSSYINALVIEFHDVHLNLNKITNFIENIDLKLIHVHPNNNSNCVNNIPIVLEFSFERNPIIVGDNVSFPHYLDQPSVQVALTRRLQSQLSELGRHRRRSQIAVFQSPANQRSGKRHTYAGLDCCRFRYRREEFSRLCPQCFDSGVVLWH